MPPSNDDQITDGTLVLRALLPKWSVVKQSRERPTTDSLTDSTFENSCFIAEEITLTEIHVLFPDLKIAVIPVRVLREHGFAIERRPDEAPPGCTVPQSHVVVGPTRAVNRGLYENAARRIVKDTAVRVISADATVL